MYVIRIVGLASGQPTIMAGLYVQQYDPSYVHPMGYQGGTLYVTRHIAEAQSWPDPGAAMEAWRAVAPPPYDVRQDGLPNRPLTAYTVEILPAEESA